MGWSGRIGLWCTCGTQSSRIAPQGGESAELMCEVCVWEWAGNQLRLYPHTSRTSFLKLYWIKKRDWILPRYTQTTATLNRTSSFVSKRECVFGAPELWCCPCTKHFITGLIKWCRGRSKRTLCAVTACGRAMQQEEFDLVESFPLHWQIAPAAPDCNAGSPLYSSAFCTVLHSVPGLCCLR